MFFLDKWSAGPGTRDARGSGGNVPADEQRAKPQRHHPRGACHARDRLFADRGRLTATVSRVLAAAGISCNVIAGSHHDHLFVDWDQGAQAVTLLASFRRASRAGEPSAWAGSQPPQVPWPAEARISSPSARMTSAPAFRPGRWPPGVSSGCGGHGRRAVGVGRSAAASKFTWPGGSRRRARSPGSVRPAGPSAPSEPLAGSRSYSQMSLNAPSPPDTLPRTPPLRTTPRRTGPGARR